MLKIASFATGPVGAFTYYVTANVRTSDGTLTWLHHDDQASVRRLTYANGTLLRASEGS